MPRPPSTLQHISMIAQWSSAILSILMCDFLFQLTSSFKIALARIAFFPRTSAWIWWRNEQPSWNIRETTSSLYELKLKLGPLKCLHYLFYPNRAVFFSTRTIFTGVRTTSPKVPARVKILVRHGWNLVRTGCLDCTFYPSRTLFLGTRAIFTRAVLTIFCIPGFQLSPISFLYKHLTHSMYRGLWACAMACANLNGTRCLFDLFLQKSSISFSDYSPQDHTNANRSYSRVFVQGDESARGIAIAFQQRWVVSEL